MFLQGVTMGPADPASDWLRDRFKLQYSYLVPAKLSPFSYSIHHSTTKLHSPWPVFTGSIIYPAECLVAAVCVLGLNSCHHPLLLSLSLKLNPLRRLASHSLGPWQAFMPSAVLSGKKERVRPCERVMQQMRADSHGSH